MNGIYKSKSTKKASIWLTYRSTIDEDDGLDLRRYITSKILQYLREIRYWSHHICNIVDP